MSPFLYLVIPSHNRKSLLERCLRCIDAQTYKNFKVVVIDDGSTDGTAGMLHEKFPSVDVLSGDGNLWWTGGVYMGVQHVLDKLRSQQPSTRQAIVLINDDLEFNKDFLENLVQSSQSHPESIIGSVVLDIDNRSVITHGGCKINWYSAKLRHVNRGKNCDDFPPDHYLDVSAVSGRGVLVPLEVFDKTGNFDKKRFPQHGDLEFGVRAQRNQFKLIASYKAKVYCHFNLENDTNQKARRGFKDAWNLLTDQRSYLNIRERFWFAVQTRKNPVQFVSFLCFDALRTLKSVVQKSFRF